MIEDLMQQLKEEGHYTWNLPLPEDFVAYTFSEEELSEEIRELSEEGIWRIRIAPWVPEELKLSEAGKDDREILIAATASPFKFPEKFWRP